MATYARVLMMLNEGQSRQFEFPVVQGKDALVTFCQTLQNITCAKIVQAELVEIIDIDGNPPPPGQYADLDMVAIVECRGADWQLYRVPVPAPIDGLVEKIRQHYQIDEDLGEQVASMFTNLTGIPVTWDGGTLI